MADEITVTKEEEIKDAPESVRSILITITDSVEVKTTLSPFETIIALKFASDLVGDNMKQKSKIVAPKLSVVH